MNEKTMPTWMIMRPGMEKLSSLEQLGLLTCTHGMIRASIKEAFEIRTWATGRTVQVTGWNCRLMLRPNGRGPDFIGYSVLLWTDYAQLPKEFSLKEDWRTDQSGIYEIVAYAMDSYLKAKGLQ